MTADYKHTIGEFQTNFWPFCNKLYRGPQSQIGCALARLGRSLACGKKFPGAALARGGCGQNMVFQRSRFGWL